MTPRIDALVNNLEQTLPHALEQHDVPGAAVGICDSEEILWCAGFGTTARHQGTPIDTSTRFSVQSTSKLYTATSVLLAVEASELDLDEPITSYLPEFTVRSVFENAPATKITLRHLLSHTAGFTHEAPIGSNYSIGEGDFEAHCQSISDTWLRFPVGHHHEYSNLGIDLAGYIIQRTHGMPFEEYVRQELFEPLGLRRSTFDLDVIEADEKRAIGHWKPFEEAGKPLPVKVPMVAAGGLYTSVADALRYVQNHLRDGEDLLDGALLQEQYRIAYPAPGQSFGYGLGLYADEWEPGVLVRHHGGSGFGFQAQLCWVPDLDVGIVMLTNSFDHSLQNETAHRIVEWLAPAPTRRVAPAPNDGGETSGADTSSADLGALAGEYVGRLDDRVRVLAENGRLRLRGAEMSEATLTGADAMTLWNARRDRLRFLRDADGRVRYLQTLRDGQVRYRNDAATTPPSTLDPKHAGTYVAAAWGVPVATYRIFQDGESPVIGRLDDDEDAIALRLTAIGPHLYLSAMGEVLDLGSAPPTYANIPLTRVRE
ncbi:serine hydrolase domain-containing protein [Actinoallomurus acaciae]|uniref:Serine hydrolase domain-containing protein n=1 Tax=Actinoallomurus acaciae TaxID=502577 RepID=A0ABV5Y9Q1_9ACTN